MLTLSLSHISNLGIAIQCLKLFPYTQKYDAFNIISKLRVITLVPCYHGNGNKWYFYSNLSYMISFFLKAICFLDLFVFCLNNPMKKGLEQATPLTMDFLRVGVSGQYLKSSHNIDQNKAFIFNHTLYT